MENFTLVRAKDLEFIKKAHNAAVRLDSRLKEVLNPNNDEYSLFIAAVRAIVIYTIESETVSVIDTANGWTGYEKDFNGNKSLALSYRILFRVHHSQMFSIVKQYFDTYVGADVSYDNFPLSDFIEAIQQIFVEVYEKDSKVA